jgi:hypothetical protein
VGPQAIGAGPGCPGSPRPSELGARKAHLGALSVGGWSGSPSAKASSTGTTRMPLEERSSAREFQLWREAVVTEPHAESSLGTGSRSNLESLSGCSTRNVLRRRSDGRGPPVTNLDGDNEPASVQNAARVPNHISRTQCRLFERRLSPLSGLPLPDLRRSPFTYRGEITACGQRVPTHPGRSRQGHPDGGWATRGVIGKGGPLSKPTPASHHAPVSVVRKSLHATSHVHTVVTLWETNALDSDCSSWQAADHHGFAGCGSWQSAGGPAVENGG